MGTGPFARLARDFLHLLLFCTPVEEVSPHRAGSGAWPGQHRVWRLVPRRCWAPCGAPGPAHGTRRQLREPACCVAGSPLGAGIGVPGSPPSAGPPIVLMSLLGCPRVSLVAEHSITPCPAAVSGFLSPGGHADVLGREPRRPPGPAEGKFGLGARAGPYLSWTPLVPFLREKKRG